VLLGGEHSVTVGLTLALKEKYPALSVLQLDAHADLRDSYEGSPFNHACAGRRIQELCPLVQVGIRSMSGEEARFMGSEAGAGVRTFYAADVTGGIPADEVVAALSDEVFITIDLDVLDPSIMPATGTPEPGGLGWYQVTGLLREVARKKKVVGFDVVELSPMEGNVAPDFLAARLTYKLMGYINEYYDKG
ncbi:MAG: agmatinase family protein, partial [Thermodesulfobacteriota bacterium]